jgi:signal transduction histidine kinase
MGLRRRMAASYVLVTAAAVLVVEAVPRLVQEALGNAIKHADPASMEVRLSRVGGAVQVEIQDDGVGFDPPAAAAGHGMGLRLMRERVEELGGAFDVRTVPGRGTTVVARLGEPA